MNVNAARRHSPWGESSRRLGEGEAVTCWLALLAGWPSPVAARPTLPEGGCLSVLLSFSSKILNTEHYFLNTS